MLQFINEREALWVKVVRSIFGDEGGLKGDAFRKSSGNSVWANVIKVRQEIEKVGLNFTSSFGIEVGDAGHIKFWRDRWVDKEILGDRLKRLHALETNREAKVVE